MGSLRYVAVTDKLHPYRDMKAIDQSMLELRRAIPETTPEIEATLQYFWHYCINPHLIELSDGTVLHIPESGHPGEFGRPNFCTDCGHGAYVKGETLCGNCLPMECMTKGAAMSNLPTREDAAFFIANYNEIIGPVDIGPQHNPDSAIAIVEAYASGRLIDSQAINYEAVAAILATDNGHDWGELVAEAAAARKDATDYDPSVLLVELYLATAIELLAADPRTANE